MRSKKANHFLAIYFDLFAEEENKISHEIYLFNSGIRKKPRIENFIARDIDIIPVLENQELKIFSRGKLTQFRSLETKN